MRELHTNDVISYYPNSLWGRVISNLSGKYSHISIAASDTVEITVLPFAGVHFRRIQFDRQFDIYRLRPQFVLGFDEKRAWNFIYRLVETRARYDYLGLVAFLFKWPILNFPEKFYCNELVDDFFFVGGVDLLPGQLTWQCSPTDVANSNLLTMVRET